MDDDLRNQNQAAFRRLKDQIERTYEKGRFVAVADDRVVADASTLPELHQLLDTIGPVRKRAVVVRVGDSYPEYSDIFA